MAKFKDLHISYPANWFFQHQEIDDHMPFTSSHGSGSGFGERDHDWYDITPERAKKLAAHAKKVLSKYGKNFKIKIVNAHEPFKPRTIKSSTPRKKSLSSRTKKCATVGCKVVPRDKRRKYCSKCRKA